MGYAKLKNLTFRRFLKEVIEHIIFISVDCIYRFHVWSAAAMENFVSVMFFLAL